MSISRKAVILVAAFIVGLLTTPYLHANKRGRPEPPVEKAGVKDSGQKRPGETTDEHNARVAASIRAAEQERARNGKIGLIGHYTRGVKGGEQDKVKKLASTLLQEHIIPSDLNQFVQENIEKVEFADKVAKFVRALAVSGIYDDILKDRRGSTKITLAEVLYVPGRPQLRLRELFLFLRYSVRRGDSKMEAWLEELTVYTLSPDARGGFVDKPRDAKKNKPGHTHGHQIHSCIPTPPNIDLATMDKDEGAKCEP